MEHLDPRTAAGIVYGLCLCYAGGVAMFIYCGLAEGMTRDRRGFATVVVASLLWPLALALALSGLATAFLWGEDHKKTCGKAKGQVAPDASADKKVGEDNKERIHGDGHAGEQAGRWKVTLKEQGRNKRNNRMFTLFGETHPMPYWCERFNTYPQLVMQRLKRGWSVEAAFTEEVQ